MFGFGLKSKVKRIIREEFSYDIHSIYEPVFDNFCENQKTFGLNEYSIAIGYMVIMMNLLIENAKGSLAELGEADLSIADRFIKEHTIHINRIIHYSNIPKEYSGNILEEVNNNFNSLKEELDGKDNLKETSSEEIYDDRKMPDGHGTFTIPGGTKYVGEWKDDKMHGQGTLTTASGEKYVGEYKDDKMHGQGTMTNAYGEYIGEFKDGEINGQGTFTYATGDKYVGEFKDGVSHGHGTLTYPGGEKYVGEYKDGLRHGRGTKIFPSGSSYIGEFKDDKTNGQGTYIWENGDKYVGEWKDDKQHGQGTYTLSDGTKEEGIFKDGKFLG
jgi:hypothetical protein